MRSSPVGARVLGEQLDRAAPVSASPPSTLALVGLVLEPLDDLAVVRGADVGA